MDTDTISTDKLRRLVPIHLNGKSDPSEITVQVESKGKHLRSSAPSDRQQNSIPYTER